MSRPWMPLYVSDYLGDTRRLKTIEHGAYMLLIMEYWQHGGLPDDDAELADIAGLEPDEWMAMRQRIARFFHDGWKHKRIDDELAKAEEISGRRSASAKRRWSNCNANAEQEQSNRDARAPVPPPPPQPPEASASLERVTAPKRADEVRETLLGGLRPEIADALIEHRKKKRAPLTPFAAKHLLVALLETGDANRWATTMIANGWQGFKPEYWQARPPPNGSPQPMKTNLRLQAIEESQADANRGYTVIIPGL